MKKTYPVVGMHCAGCALKIEKAVGAIPGVKSVVVNYAAEKVTVELEEEKDTEELREKLKKVVASVGGYTLVVDQGNSKLQMTNGKHHEGAGHEERGGHDHAAMLKEEAVRDLKKRVVVNILLSVPVLVGAISGWMPLEMQFVLTSVVLFWGGKQFFVNALFPNSYNKCFGIP